MKQEEKAKQYDEKLDVARHIYADPSVKDEDKYYIEVIFPELKESEAEKPNGGIVSEDLNEGDGFYKVNLAYLSKEQVEEIESLVKKWNPEIKESEDEKIRKVLLNDFKNNCSEYYCEGVNRDMIIAWLEKQGEKGTNGNKGEFPIPEPPLTIKHAKEVMGIEQKPADKVEPKFKVGDIVKHKDNPHLTYILRRFTDDGDYEFHAIGKDDTEGATCFAVVKYQDEWELVEQNSAWSEEDEKMHAAVLQLITDSEKENGWNCVYCNDKEIYFSDIIAWLKSLRPQNTWKPSKKQLEALEHSLGDYNIKIFEDRHEILKSLYQDLKKLREEQL